MSDHIDWERLARYVAGEATSAESAEVERWAAGHAERQSLLASVARHWRAAARPNTRDVDTAWARLSAKLSSAPSAQDEDDSVIAFPLRRDGRRWSAATLLLPLAAGIVLVAGVTLVWQASRSKSTGSLGSMAMSARTEARTGVGERHRLDLADGSTVLLAATSVLRVPDNYGARERHVFLEGRALFRVQHDSARPFFVHAAGTVSEDLGTEFEVRAYPGDSAVSVAVWEGAVAVRRDRAVSDSVVLGPRDMARLTESGEPIVLHDQNIERLLAWTNGEIVFDDAPLSEVAEELERWFDIKCRFADSSLKTLHLTTPFSAGASLEDVLGVIGKSLGALGLRVQREAGGRVVTFTRGTALAYPPAIDQPRRVEAGEAEEAEEAGA